MSEERPSSADSSSTEKEVDVDDKHTNDFKEESSNVEKESTCVEKETPKVENESSNIGDKASKVEKESTNVGEGPMSRAESLYYTPDVTSDKLDQLSLQ